MQSPSSQDAAVSPAIGTILLVAMTVVFVAVAAVVAMGLAGGMFDMKQVGLTLKPYAFSGENPEHGIGILVHGGKDAGDLVSLSASIGNPALTYNKNESVSNPQIGVDYQFAAYVDPVVIEGIRNGQVNLTTIAAQSAAELERYVTVTGTFRDGTQQVLLIQKVLIPAIPGNEGNFAGDYVKVLPYYIDDQYPAHGFYVEIINTTAVKELKVVSFDITWPKEKKSAVLTEKDKKKVSRTYDVSPSTAPKANDGSQWDSTPYPKTDVNNFWILGTLKGNVTISLTPQPGQNVLSPVTVPLTIPPRVNIFENTSIHAGNIWYDGEKITYTPAKGSSNSPCYYIISSGEPVKLSDSNNAKDQLEANKGKTLEAYVKVPISSTFVWYRVASVKIDDKFLNP